MTTDVTIVCAACGMGTHADVSEAPRFGVDLAVIAEAVGFNYVFDIAYGRVVIFCGDRCKTANITKRGHLRRYIIAPKEQAA
jgi:hypothetical protein